MRVVMVNRALASSVATARASQCCAAMTRGILLAGLLCVGACHRSAPSSAAAAAAPAPAAAHAAHEGGEGRRQQQAAGTLEVVVNGKPAGAWSSEQLAKSSVSGTNQNGEAREFLALKTITQ